VPFATGNKHDTSFAECLFPVANGGRIVYAKVVKNRSFMVRVGCRSDVSATSFKDIIDVMF